MLIHLKNLYSWLFPATCILCHYPSDRSQDLCQSCLDELPILPQTCPRCAKTLWIEACPNFICGTCLKQPPPFDAAFALFSYQKPVTKLIMELKFHQKLLNAKILGELMGHAIQEHWYLGKSLPDIIIPMPLHTLRLRERGFNQALEIARPISRLLHIPIDTASCRRIRHTQAQARLSGSKRLQNVKNAFSVERDFRGLHVAVLDDVTTTGHSISEFAKTLKQAGNPRIDAWFCARTLIEQLPS